MVFAADGFVAGQAGVLHAFEHAHDLGRIVAAGFCYGFQQDAGADVRTGQAVVGVELEGVATQLDQRMVARRVDAVPVLGAEVHTIGCEPDGLNINRGVGAQHPGQLVETVRARGADLGIALDGDADRILMVDGDGRIYYGDELLYVIVQEHLCCGHAVDGVVGTLMTNFGFEKRMRDLGLGFHRADVGDRYVLEALNARGWRFGGENSGHLLCLDHHTTGDGIIAALQVLTAMRRRQQTLAQLLQTLPLYPQAMVNVPLAPGSAWRTHPGLQTAIRNVEQMLAGRGRVLVRASGTEPKLRLMVEAEEDALAQQALDALLAVDLTVR